MSIHSLAIFAACTAAALGSALLATPATAITRDVILQQNGAGPCQATLPTYLSQLRWRPLGVQNEGTRTAFVSCSPPTLQGIFPNDTLGYAIRLINRRSSVVAVSCTAVVGSDGVNNPLPVYLTKTVSIGGNSSALLTWRSLEGYGTSVPFNFQCQLPTGIGLSSIELNQVLDVGN